MKRLAIAVVDHGAGNLASVARAITGLGHRCRISHDNRTLAAADVVVLPGVGAFPAAMASLHRLGLVDGLRRRADDGQPLIGICLGMQLLADCSLEQGLTEGLGLIAGRVRALGEPRWHIGWNTIDVRPGEPLLAAGNGRALYFNHAYVLDTEPQFRVAQARVHDNSFTVAVRRGNVVGLQFHPEKSQGTGRTLLQQVLEGTAHA